MNYKIILIITLLLSTTISNGQSRSKFKYRLSDKNLGSTLFLKNNDTTLSLGTKVVGEKTKNIVRRCLIKLSSTGVITVDFWSITDSLNSGDLRIVNHRTLIKDTKITDGRKTIGQPVKVLKVWFNTLTYGVSTIPFRLRFPTKIDSSESTQTLLSSPKPDIALSVGWTIGRSIITSRQIVNYSGTLGGFLGVSSAEIKDGSVNSKSELYLTKKVQTNPALVYGISFTAARNNIGLFVALGFEHSFNKYSSDWIYQHKPWLGLGLNANLGFF